MSDDLRIGSEYRGHYRVEERIGSGGTSVVYRLHHLSLGREDCLKKAVVRGAYTRPQLESLFVKEARALKLLEGSHSPTLWEFDGLSLNCI